MKKGRTNLDWAMVLVWGWLVGLCVLVWLYVFVLLARTV